MTQMKTTHKNCEDFHFQKMDSNTIVYSTNYLINKTNYRIECVSESASSILPLPLSFIQVSFESPIHFYESIQRLTVLRTF